MKLQLKVELFGFQSVMMTIVYICDEALTDRILRDGNIFEDDNGVTIWSCGDFIFDNRQIRLPQRDKVLTKLKHTHQFKSEEERYEVLKKFYTTLTRWSLNTKIFPNTNTDIKRRIIINQDYWCII